MGLIQKDAVRTMLISYLGMAMGYVNKGLLFFWLLKENEIGLINLLLNVGTLFGNLSGLGSTYAIWKFFPFLRNTEKRHFGFLPLILMVSGIGAVLFSAIMWLFHAQIVQHYSEKSAAFVQYYYWIIPLGIASLLFNALDYFLRSMYRNVVGIFAYELLLRILIFAELVIYGMHVFNFETFLIIHFLLYFIPVMILVWYLFRIGELNLSFGSISVPKRFRRIIISYSLLSYLNSVGALIVATIDAMMIASMLGLSETGIYTQMMFLVSALQIPYKSMMRISAPLIADYWKDRNMSEMSKLYKKFSSVSLVIAFAMFLLIWTCREELFHFLPAGYHQGIWVFLVLMIGRLTDMYFGLNGNIFGSSKKFKWDIVFTISLIAIVSLMNYFLIPKYGIIGSAIATTVAYLIYNAGRLLFVYFAYGIHPFEIRQLYVMMLFAVVTTLFELIPFGVGNDVLSILLKWTLLLLVFGLPVYKFKLEPEIARYVDNAYLVIRQRIGKK